MRHGRSRKAAFILPISVLSLAMGCQNPSEKIRRLSCSIRSYESEPMPIIQFTSCFANIGWVTVASNGTVDWTAGAGDTNTYQVAFPTNPYPLIDSIGNPVTTPIVVDKSGTQSGTNKGPFAIGPSAVDACKAGADAASAISATTSNTMGQSCIKHYGSGFGIYSTGIHIER